MSVSAANAIFHPLSIFNRLLSIILPDHSSPFHPLSPPFYILVKTQHIQKYLTFESFFLVVIVGAWQIARQIRLGSVFWSQIRRHPRQGMSSQRENNYNLRNINFGVRG